jgi:hypothetical protein
VAYAAEPSVACGNQRFEHRLRALPEHHVGVPDNAGDQLRFAISAARAHGRDAVRELHLADGFHLRRPVRAIHRAALDEDRREDVVAGADHVIGKLVDQVAAALRVVPRVMVRIDDREIRLQRGLLPLPRPCVYVSAVAVRIAAEFVRFLHRILLDRHPVRLRGQRISPVSCLK